METNKNKYSLGNYPFLQYFAESQDGGSGEGGEGGTNPEGSNGDGNSNTGDTSNNPEQSGGGDGSNGGENPNDNPKTFDEKYVADLRKENAKYRTQRNEATEKFETFANDLKGFLEKNGVQMDNAEGKSMLEALDKIIGESKASVFNAELDRVAAQHNIVDAEILAKLIDVESLKFESGKYVGLEEQVKAIAESKPYLVKQAQQTETPKPPKGGQGQGGAPKPLTKNDLESMTPAQIAQAFKSGELKHLL